MENKTDEYALLIHKLREAKPVLQDAEGLTESIMQQVNDNTHLPVPRLLIWVRAVSSAAAVFLLGLFLFQQTEPRHSVSEGYQAQAVEINVKTDFLADCYPLSDSTNVMQAYLCYLHQISLKKTPLINCYEVL